MVICIEWGADLHTAQLMPLPLTVCCFSKIQIGFTFLVPAHPGSPGQRAVKRVYVILYDVLSVETRCMWVGESHTASTRTGMKLRSARRASLQVHSLFLITFSPRAVDVVKCPWSSFFYLRHFNIDYFTLYYARRDHRSTTCSSANSFSFREKFHLVELNVLIKFHQNNQKVIYF